MSTSLSLGPQPLLSFSPIHRFRFRTSQFQTPLFHRSHFSAPSLSRTLTVAKFGPLGSGHLPDPEASQLLLRELFARAEGLLYTIADAAVSNSEAVSSKTQQSNDWFSGISSYMEIVLKFLKDGLTEVHVPYAYGFAIILLTVIVKAATFPLTKKQVESAMAMKSLQPQIKAIQERYAGDQERIQLETARIYKLAGINPLAGCLPTLATIPIWIGLYRALSNVANEGLLTEGFFWIPSLAGPTTVAARQNGSGTSWLFPFVDGQPPLGWSDTLSYLVLPVLLVVSQYISVQIMQTSQSNQSNDPNLKASQAITKFLPLMIGYFALSVPSGLSLYWLTNNLLSTAQQVWLQKLGGAKNPIGAINEQILMEEKSRKSAQTQQVSNSPGERFKRLKEEEERSTKSTQTDEVSNSTGLRPGERFKRLKEEEERRRRQREEEKKRGEEITANGVSAEEKDEKIAEMDQGNNSHPVEMIGKDMKANDSHISSSSQSVMNGDSAVMASRKYESTSIPVDDKVGQSDDAGDEQDNEVAEGRSGKEVAEVGSGATSMEDRSQGESKTGPNWQDKMITHKRSVMYKCLEI